ncbi:MAG: polyprenyl diphosphate synthase [Pseudomonadales bacterium]
MSSLQVTEALPRHVAIIMDGNNRWARANKLKAVAAGHQAGVEAIRGVLEACQDTGVKTLTLFAFSSENWARPVLEVKALMSLFSRYLKTEVPRLHGEKMRLRFIGRRDRFNEELQKDMQAAEQLTASNMDGTLVIAADYGGQWDITQAALRMAEDIASGRLSAAQVDDSVFDGYLSIADIPKPDLLIRTGGEHRISNFLLWQAAYTEMYFTDTYWPDFDKAAFRKAIAEYLKRERRFGHTSNALATNNKIHFTGTDSC